MNYREAELLVYARSMGLEHAIEVLFRDLTASGRAGVFSTLRRVIAEKGED